MAAKATASNRHPNRRIGIPVCLRECACDAILAACRDRQERRFRAGLLAIDRPCRKCDRPCPLKTRKRAFWPAPQENSRRAKRMADQLRGVIAAIATAVDETGEPDCARSTALARYLLGNGCDGLNVLGTTGEATSFSLEQRKRVMTAYRDAGLQLGRLMGGSGSASVSGPD